MWIKRRGFLVCTCTLTREDLLLLNQILNSQHKNNLDFCSFFSLSKRHRIDILTLGFHIMDP